MVNERIKDMIYLKFPSLEDQVMIEAYRAEFLAQDQKGIIHGGSQLGDVSFTFDAWLKNVQGDRDKETVREGLVPAHTFVVMHGHNMVGICQVRHELNDFLLHCGGHIGYSIRPSQRQKGFAKAALALALQFLFEQKGVERVLVTCDQSNIASKRTIEACGGVFENVVIDDKDQEPVMRYWFKRL